MKPTLPPSPHFPEGKMEYKDCINCEFYLTGELGLRCGYYDDEGLPCWQDVTPESSKCPGDCLTGCRFYIRATKDHPEECSLGEVAPDPDDLSEAQNFARLNGACVEYEEARPLDTVIADPGGDSLLKEVAYSKL